MPSLRNSSALEWKHCVTMRSNALQACKLGIAKSRHVKGHEERHIIWMITPHLAKHNGLLENVFNSSDEEMVN